MFTKLWQCRKKCAVDSTSKLYKHRRFMQSSKLWLNQCSLRWLNPSLQFVSSFNPKGIVGRGVLYPSLFSNFVQPLPVPSNLQSHCSFCCLVSLAEWLIAPHLMWYFTYCYYSSTYVEPWYLSTRMTLVCVLCNKASSMLRSDM